MERRAIGIGMQRTVAARTGNGSSCIHPIRMSVLPSTKIHRNGKQKGSHPVSSVPMIHKDLPCTNTRFY